MDEPEKIPPRLAPHEALPPYSYVPRRFPHPSSDPAGHSYGREEPALEVSADFDWLTCLPYRRGIDLFHHGYYWEAHEAWETLWLAAPRMDRSGLLAAFCKGLIKLAAAGVKLREGNARGARRHARRAETLFRQVLESVPQGEPDEYGSLSLARLIHNAQFAHDEAERLVEAARTVSDPRPLLPPLFDAGDSPR